MPPVRKRARKSAAPRKSRSTATPSANDIWRRTRLLVEVLLEVMEQGIRAPDSERSEQWERLFGTKDSAVVNLQKLVQLLAELQAQSGSTLDDAHALVEPVSSEEMALLAQWLEQVNAPSES